MNSSRICLYASGCLQHMPPTRPTLCNFSNRFGVMLDAAVDWQSTLIGASLLAIQKRFTISSSVRRVERNSMGAPYARVTRVCDARSVLKTQSASQMEDKLFQSAKFARPRISQWTAQMHYT